MYSIQKDPSNKVLVKSRRNGLPPRMDSFENRGNIKNRRDQLPVHEISYSRHFYHSSNNNSSYGKKSYYNHSRDQRVISPQHQEMISYIHRSWEGVMRDYENSSQLNSTIPFAERNVAKVAYYKDENVSRHMPKIEPLGIEPFWGQRIFQNIPHQPLARL